MPYAYLKERVVGRIRGTDLGDVPEAFILCMGDLHMGDRNTDIEMIRLAVEWLLDGPNRYALITGDLFNMALRSSVSFQGSEPDMSVKDTRHLLARILEPIRSHVLGVIPGNHDDRLSRDAGEDSVDALCCELGIPYHPEGEMFLQLKVGAWKHSGKPVTFSGYCAHGNAGGRLPGGKANGLVAMRGIVHNADFYFNGHGHTPLVIPEVAWRFDSRGAILKQDQMCISCGSTLSRGGYPVRKSYPPLSTVYPTLTLYGDGYKHMTAHAAT